LGKGDDFEREVARILSEWFSGGQRNDLFWRKRTRSRQMRRTKTTTQLGDIMADHPEGMPLTNVFSIELKVGYSTNKKPTKKVKLTPWDLLDSIDYVERANRIGPPNLAIIDFWEQTLRDARLVHKIPWLIFKRDYHVHVASLQRRDVAKLMDLVGPFGGNYLQLCMPSQRQMVRFYRLSEFLEWLTPDVVKILDKERTDAA